MNRYIPSIGVLLLLLGFVAGCGEMAASDLKDSDPAIDTESRAMVTPEFRVVGHDALPEQVSLDSFDINVAQMRFLASGESVEESSQVAMGTTSLNFDLTRDQTRIVGDEFGLGSDADYTVQLQVESDEYWGQTEGDSTSDTDRGFLALMSVQDDDSSQQSDGGDDHGNPLPLPVVPDEQSDEDGQQAQAQWLPLAATGQTAAPDEESTFEIASGGQQRLVFEFDVAELFDGLEGFEDYMDCSTFDDDVPEIDVEALINSSTVSVVDELD